MPVDDLWTKKGPDGKPVPSARHGRGKRYRVRYTDPAGRAQTRSFDRKGEAERYDARVRSDVATGKYIDAAAGQETFRDYAETWRANQVHRESTAKQIETHFRGHVYDYLGGRQIRAIRHSHIQGLVRHLTSRLAPATVEVVYRYVSAVFRTAVIDKEISETPCQAIRLPDVEKKRIRPLPIEVVKQLREAKPRRYRVLDDLGAMAGLRHGEALGLEVSAIDFLRRHLRVEQQLMLLPGQQPFLAPPKTKKSHRKIPISRTLVDRLAAHLAEFPPIEVEIVDKTGPKPVVRMARFVVLSTEGTPVRRTSYSAAVWRPSVAAVGLADAPTFHDLRHFYASALIAKGASVRQVQERLGHATADETMSTYSHLWPDEDDRTRTIIDDLFREDDDGQDQTKAVP